MEKLATFLNPAITTDPQWEALGRIWAQWDCFRKLPFSTFLQDHCFLAIGLQGCIMVRARPFYGGEMWIGIETDGYSHT